MAQAAQERIESLKADLAAAMTPHKWEGTHNLPNDAKWLRNKITETNDKINRLFIGKHPSVKETLEQYKTDLQNKLDAILQNEEVPFYEKPFYAQNL